MSVVPVMELTAHRVIWALVILAIIITFQGNIRKTLGTIKQPKIIALHLLSGVVLAANWMLYVWATLHDRIIEGALGYYINPFLYILLGSIFLGEKHSRLQMIAIVVAAAGVAIQFKALQGVPWVALALAFSFTFYGILRKKSPLGSLDGLVLESTIMLPVALGYVVFLSSQSASHFGNDASMSWMLVATGVATASPLLCFARGAREISLSLLGILQFIGPTGQFFIGWLMYHEPLPPIRLVSFALIWLAVALYIFSMQRKLKSPLA